MRLKQFFVLAALGIGAATVSAQTDAAFEELFPLDQIFAKKSNIWRSYEALEGQWYAVTAKRKDGMMLVVTKGPSYSNPKKLSYVGYFMKCGVMQDHMVLFQQNVQGLKDVIAKPDLNATFRISEGTPIHWLYSQVCPTR